MTLGLQEWLMLSFTGVIAASTVIYTVVTYRLWKATRASADIARYSAFMAYMTAAATEIEKTRATNPSGAAFLENFVTLIAEIGLQRFLEDVDLKKDRDAREYFSKIEGMFRAHGIDPETIPWLRVVLRKMRE